MNEKPVAGEFPYEPLQDTTVSIAKPAYSVSSGPLPAHIRSLCPKHDTSVHVTLNNNDGAVRSFVSTKVVYVILVAIFLVSSTIAVMVAILEVRAILRQSSKTSQTWKTVSPTTATNSSGYSIKKVSGIEMMTLLAQDNRDRTHCFRACLVYTHPEFQSRCEAGYCVCEGKHFIRKTCLPSIDGCSVSSRPTSLSSASMSGMPSTVYSCCSDKNKWSDVYVISIYGNHFAPETIVNLVGDSQKPVTVVLASHFSIRWKLKYDAVTVNDVILVSDRTTNSEVRIQTSSDGSDDGSPNRRSYLLPVGYGPDRYNPYTVRMLQAVGRHIGPVKSFVGMDYADFITLNIPST